MDISKIKATIRSMLNLAADEAATEGEKNNAMAHVSRLMDQYNLQEEDLEHVDNILDEVSKAEVGAAYYQCGQRVCAWHGQLAMFVVGLIKSVRVSILVLHKRDPDKSRRIMFYGVKSDADLALEVFEETTRHITQLAEERYGKSQRGDGYSYCLGFVKGLHDTLKVQPVSGSTSLVVARTQLVVKKQELADAWRKENGFTQQGQGPANFKIKRDPFGAGVADGKQHKVYTQRQIA